MWYVLSRLPSARISCHEHHIVVQILQIVYVAGFVARDPRFSSVEAGGDARDPVGVRKS